MAQPGYIVNERSQSIDALVAPDGTVKTKLGVGIVDLAGLAVDAAWQGVATHVDGDVFVANDGIIVIGGVDGTDVPTKALVVDGRMVFDDPDVRVKVSQTPTVSSGSAYAVKDAIGALLTFAGVARTGFLSGVLETVTIVDKGQQMKALDLVLFSASLTAPTDNAIFDPTDAELLTCIGVVKIAAGDYFDFNDNSVASVRLNHPYVLAGTPMYGVLVARDTPTYTSTTDIVVTLSARRD